MKIGVIDYGAGNLGSLISALEQLDFDPILVNSKYDLEKTESLILPGVGAFNFGMQKLNKLDLMDSICNEIRKGKLFLGICLGMQLLASEGTEHENLQGLNVIRGRVLALPDMENVRIPHIGWEKIYDLEEKFLGYFYFAHSYFYEVSNKNVVKYIYKWGTLDLPAVINQENVFGLQFHPEKSGETGLKLLKHVLSFN